MIFINKKERPTAMSWNLCVPFTREVPKRTRKKRYAKRSRIVKRLWKKSGSRLLLKHWAHLHGPMVAIAWLRGKSF